MAKVTIYSVLSGKPFVVELDNYPHHELPRLSDEDITNLKAKPQLSVLELALLYAERARARKKIRFYKRAA